MRYDRAKLGEAVEKIKRCELSLRKASQEYGIPYSTLRDKVGVNANPGAAPVLTNEEELKLKDYLIRVAELGVGKSRSQVQELGYMIVYRDPARNMVAQRWVNNRRAGKDWYYAFIDRHN